MLADRPLLLPNPHQLPSPVLEAAHDLSGGESLMHNPDTGLTWTFDDFPGPVPQDVPDRWWPPRPRKQSGGRGRHRVTGVSVGEETRHGSRVSGPVPLAVFPGVKTKGNTMTIEATDIDNEGFDPAVMETWAEVALPR